MKNIGYFVSVHDLYSLNRHRMIIQNNNILKNVDFKYICGIDPKKTDIYKQQEIPIKSTFDSKSIYCLNNKILRQHSTYIYILEHLNEFDYDYISIEGCTTLRYERYKYQNINDHTMYTTLRKSDCIMKYKEYYDDFYNIFNIDLLNNFYFFLFDYLIFHKSIASVLHEMFINNFNKILNYKFKKFYPELLDYCIYMDYLKNFKNKFDIKNLKFKFHLISDKKLHFYS